MDQNQKKTGIPQTTTMAFKIYTFLVLACLICGVAFSLTVLGSCEYMEANGVTDGKDVSGAQVGLYRYSLAGSGLPWDTNGECRDYSNRPSDGWHRAAQVCGAVAAFTGLVLLTLVIVRQCCCPIPCSGILVSLSYITVQIMQGLVWLMFNNDICKTSGISCDWSQAASFNLLAQIFYFAAGCFHCCMEDPREAAMGRKADKAEKKAEEAEKRAEEAEERAEAAEKSAAEAEAGEAGGDGMAPAAPY